MKIKDIYTKFNNGEKITISGKGLIKSIKLLKDGNYEIKYEKPPQAKFYGRLTFC